MPRRPNLIAAVLTAAVLVTVGLVASAAPARRGLSRSPVQNQGFSERGSAPSRIAGVPAVRGIQPDPAVGAAGSAPDRAPIATGGASPASAEADLRTFAFATTDLASMRASLDATVRDAEALMSAADAWNMAAVREAGATLEADARELASRASGATMRLHTLTPASPALRTVRDQALAAFSVASSQAQAALDLADFAITLDPAKAATTAESINALGRGEVGVSTALGEVAAALERWAAANPEAAARAMAVYA